MLNDRLANDVRRNSMRSSGMDRCSAQKNVVNMHHVSVKKQILNHVCLTCQNKKLQWSAVDVNDDRLSYKCSDQLVTSLVLILILIFHGIHSFIVISDCMCFMFFFGGRLAANKPQLINEYVTLCFACREHSGA